MKVLVIGGTGLISTAIVQQLVDRGDVVTVFNRGQTPVRVQGPIETVLGNRWEPGSLERAVSGRTWDAVIDMTAFAPENGEQLVRLALPGKPVLKATDAPPDPRALSRFTAPPTVRVSANRSANGNELTVHFVNYNRREPEKPRSPGRGIVDDNPLAVEGVTADLVIPAGFRVGKVCVSTPEEPEAVEVKAEVKDGRLRFAVPKFLVYALVRVELEAR